MSISTFTRFALMAAVLFVVGCQSVTTTAITGTPSEKDAKIVQGMWKFNDMIFLLKATDDGQLMFANIDWKQKQWAMGQRVVTVTTAGDHKLLYMGTSEPDKDHPSDKPVKDQPNENYLFFKLLYHDKAPDSVVIYLPNPDTFANAIKKGKLKGEVTKTHKGKVEKVVMSATAESLEAFIKETPTHELFRMESPFVMVRMK